ncbi:hypothetical protein SAMN05892883_4273 [Jatrophihabitans sp. GAS493]|nr:hypothetical protein SAMN05892883_4273 [Jatrophihabitans sp. GAS493]
MPPPTQLLTGSETIPGADCSVAAFWSWAMSDLRSNTTRPLLAEFLVARALGADHRPRIEWDSCDVITSKGLRVEVKSGGYLQSWQQHSLSRIIFGGLRAGILDASTNTTTAPDYNADVYVFALFGALTHDDYDALDTTAWQFWVAPREIIAATQQRQLALSRVRQLARGPIEYTDLAQAIDEAAAP